MAGSQGSGRVHNHVPCHIRRVPLRCPRLSWRSSGTPRSCSEVVVCCSQRDMTVSFVERIAPRQPSSPSSTPTRRKCSTRSGSMMCRKRPAAQLQLDQRLGNGSFPRGKAYHQQALPWLMQRMSTLRSKAEAEAPMGEVAQLATSPSTHTSPCRDRRRIHARRAKLSATWNNTVVSDAGAASPSPAEKIATSCRPLRNRILDKLAAAGVSVHNLSPHELQKLAKHRPEEERGQMSYEARAIRGAKDKVQRAKKIKGADYKRLADRFHKDSTFAARQAENGLTRGHAAHHCIWLPPRSRAYSSAGDPRRREPSKLPCVEVRGQRQNGHLRRRQC